MNTSRGRSRSVSKLPEGILTIPLSQLDNLEQNSQNCQKTLFPLIRHIAASQKMQKRDKGPAPKPKMDCQNLAQQVKKQAHMHMDVELDSKSIFKIHRTNKSLKSIKIKRKRTYYWKLFELASLFMVKLILIF